MTWQRFKLADLTDDLTEKRKVSIKDEEEVIEPTIITREHKISVNSIKKGNQLKIKDRILIKKGDLVFSKLHTQNGAFAFSDREFKSTTTFLPLKIKEEKVISEYLFWLLHILVPNLRSSDTVGRETYKSRDILNIELRLPSIEEQKRIIERFLSLREKILSSYQKFNNNLELIKKLRQAILQEAVQGKLVKQDPKDEPTSELLKKIKAEKDKLIKEGKIRKEKPLPLISDDEIPYELPRGWECCRLGEICEEITDIEHKMPKSVEKGIKFISAKDIDKNFKLNLSDNVKRISEDDFNRLSSRIKPKINDIIYSRIGTVGKVAIVDTSEKFLPSYSCCVIRPLIIDLKYLSYYLESRILIETLEKHTRSIGVPDLGILVIKNFIIELPPLSEQKRIVEKVDQLMALCNELEKHVKENQDNAEKLMEAVLRESFEK